MAYNAYSNFINPVRQPNSSLFPGIGINHNRVNNYNQIAYNQQPQHNRQNRQNNKLIHNAQQVSLQVQPHHLPNYHIDNIPPHMINNNKRLELIQKEKDNLYKTLKDNELLERELLHKSEKAIKLHQLEEVDKVKITYYHFKKRIRRKGNFRKNIK